MIETFSSQSKHRNLMLILASEMFIIIFGIIKNKIIIQPSYHTTIKSTILYLLPSKPMFAWSMPFDYNISRINQQPIFVHEEMRLPKSWKGFGDLNQFNATVNGQQLSGRSLAIDPFSFPNDTIVHFLVNKNDIIKIARCIQCESYEEIYQYYWFDGFRINTLHRHHSDIDIIGHSYKYW